MINFPDNIFSSTARWTAKVELAFIELWGGTFVRFLTNYFLCRLDVSCDNKNSVFVGINWFDTMLRIRNVSNDDPSMYQSINKQINRFSSEFPSQIEVHCAALFSDLQPWVAIKLRWSLIKMSIKTKSIWNNHVAWCMHDGKRRVSQCPQRRESLCGERDQSKAKKSFFEGMKIHEN